MFMLGLLGYIALVQPQNQSYLTDYPARASSRSHAREDSGRSVADLVYTVGLAGFVGVLWRSS